MRVVAALPALRALRRLQPAASGSARAGRDQAARPGGQPRAHRKVQPEAMLPADPRPGLGIPPSRAHVGAAWWRARAGCWWAFASAARHYVVDMDSCEVLPRAHLRADRAAARPCCRRPCARSAHAAGRDRGRRRRRRAGAARPRSACAARSRAAAGVRAHATAWIIYLQPGGPDYAAAAGCRRLRGRCSTGCPSSISTLAFQPTDFTQVNHAVNRVLVRRAIALLDPQPGERIADMFCGLGNFTLAIARRGARGGRASKAARTWSARAAENAQRNGLGGARTLLVGRSVPVTRRRCWSARRRSTAC